jgi:peroxiredoxin
MPARRLVRAMILATVMIGIATSTFSAVKPASERASAPDFVLADSAGKRVSLGELKGKVVLLDFWATWCTGCKEEMPWFMEFQKTYGGRGLQSVGVAMDIEGWAKVRPYLQQHPVNYPVVVGDVGLANRFGSMPGLPVTLLIDRKGRIAEFHPGKVDRSAFEAEIRQVLAETS